MKIYIEDKMCVLCGKCEVLCPVGAIKRVDRIMEYDEKRCIGCGKCVEGCTFLAIKSI